VEAVHREIRRRHPVAGGVGHQPLGVRRLAGARRARDPDQTTRCRWLHARTLPDHLPTTSRPWAAYILTRPLGASFADWFGKPKSLTGLDLGDGTVTWTSLDAIVVLVAWVAAGGHGVQQPGGEPETERELEPV
jgi:hypothetical protein